MKKIIKIGVLALVAAFTCSCEDIYEVVYPELEISFADVENVDLDGVLHAYTGDMIVVNISGDMDLLYQYIGVPGYQYYNPDEICNYGGYCTLQIVTEIESDYTSRQKENLELLLSTDFTGVKDSININNARWIKIPYDDVNFSEENSVEVTSNLLSLWDYIPEDSEYVYVAYRYVNDAPVNVGGTYAAAWKIHDFDIRRTYADGRSQYYGLYDEVNSANDVTAIPVYAGFIEGIEWEIEGAMQDTVTDSSYNKWVIYTSGTSDGNASLAPYGSSSNGGDYIANDDYLISRKFDLSLAPADDPSVSLKGTTEDVPSSTTLYYDQAGTWTISIVARNLTIGDDKQIVKQLTVCITDPDATE